MCACDWNFICSRCLPRASRDPVDVPVVMLADTGDWTQKEIEESRREERISKPGGAL